MKRFLIIFISLTLLLIINTEINYSKPNPVKSIMKVYMDSPPVEAFRVWHYLHNKEYGINSIEGLKRYIIFKNNFHKVNSHNKNEDKSYSIGLNNFADITVDEFKKKYLVGNSQLYSSVLSNGINKNKHEENVTYQNFWDLNIPDEEEDAYMIKFLNNNKMHLTSATSSSKVNLPFQTIDWIEKAHLNEKVEDQRHCGSCWAFATVQAIQAANTIKTGEYKVFSKQQLVDCDNSSSGCQGGMIDTAMDYVKLNGLEIEEDYPYSGVGGTCLFNKKSVTKISSYEACIDKTGCQTDQALFNVLSRGPVAAVVDASEEFMLYEEGIFDKPCKEANHAILLVGYHKDNETEKEQNYWLIKNSWSQYWGQNGYIKIKQSEDYNSCLLNTYYVRPDI